LRSSRRLWTSPQLGEEPQRVHPGEHGDAAAELLDLEAPGPYRRWAPSGRSVGPEQRQGRVDGSGLADAQYREEMTGVVISSAGTAATQGHRRPNAMDPTIG